MSKKTIFIIIALVIATPIAWYLISPLWRTRVVNDASPLVVVPPVATPGTTSPTTTTVAAPVPTPPAPTARVIAQGPFTPGEHAVEGAALLINNQGKKIVRFENFKSTDGPDVHVYLSADFDNKDSVELGGLKATSGNVNYDVPPGVDTTKYNKILIWCKPFHVLFSSAELK